MNRNTPKSCVIGSTRAPVFVLLQLVFLMTTITCAVAQSARTDPAIFERYENCVQYRQFIKGLPVESSERCLPLVDFILLNNTLSNSDYSIEAARSFGRSSGIGFLAQLQVSLNSEERQYSYVWADNADRQIFHSMRLTGDNARALIYALLLSDVKLGLMQKTLLEWRIQRSRSIGFSELDAVSWELSFIKINNPEPVLMCLLRTDAFIVPIRTVFESAPFQICLNSS